MLSEHRSYERNYPIPTYDLKEHDIDDFLNELSGFHDIFYDCFQRSESRKHFFNYMSSQFSALERKSIEPIALNIEGSKVRAMQRFVSDARWDEEKMLSKYRNLLNEDMGDLDAALIFDESSFSKKGKDSVGVARQYCGSEGKVDNCQVGVFASYASPKGYAMVDKKLFLPEKWFDDGHKTRRKKCKLPEALPFKTKPQLAVDMFKNIYQEKCLPFKYVLADSLYGTNPEFLKAIDECVGLTYFVAIHSDTLCWLERPMVMAKTYKYKGEIRTKKVLESDAKKPISVKSFAQNINDFFWYRRKVSEGTKGPIEYEFTKRRVVLHKGGLPDKVVWLIIKRTLGDKPEYSYFISNASTSTRMKTFVWLSGLRWSIEQCFRECKHELGMDHYEVRKYNGWHHHMLTCMLAHFFLWHVKIKMGKKSSLYYIVTD